MPRFVTNMFFDTQAHEAAAYYCSIFPNSEITSVIHQTEAGPGEAGTVMLVDFQLDAKPFTAINGGPHLSFSEAVSSLIDCGGQDEVDRYWEALCDGGQPGRCGWLKDRYGFSWQVCPKELAAVLGDPDPERAARAVAAMLDMTKIDIAAVRAAADG